MKYSLFIGRWQVPYLHNGHIALINLIKKENKNICIAIRNTKKDDKNPYSIRHRKKIIKKAFPTAKIIVIPDIEEIVYGREVGYGIREIKLSKDLEIISGTNIRKEIEDKGEYYGYNIYSWFKQIWKDYFSKKNISI